MFSFGTAPRYEHVTFNYGVRTGSKLACQIVVYVVSIASCCCRVEVQNKLYIRLPVKITEELQVKELHKNIVEVSLARQKSARWCIARFESEDKLREALKDLKQKKINGKSIVAKIYRKERPHIVGTDTEQLKKLIKSQFA